MGHYLQVPERDKVLGLILLGAVIINPPESFHHGKDSVIVCVIHNPSFDAAGIVFDADEFHDFAVPEPGDVRPRTWLAMSRAKVLELNPDVEEVLE